MEEAKPKRRARNGRYAQRRGADYEREVAAWMNARVYGREAVYRRPLSGGGRYAAKEGKGDQDLVGAELLHVECKRTNALRLEEALQQAEASCGPGELPVVISRRDGQTTGGGYAIMRLEDWAPLYAAALVLAGVKINPDLKVDVGPLPDRPANQGRLTATTDRPF